MLLQYRHVSTGAFGSSKNFVLLCANGSVRRTIGTRLSYYFVLPRINNDYEKHDHQPV